MTRLILVGHPQATPSSTEDAALGDIWARVSAANPDTAFRVRTVQELVGKIASTPDLSEVVIIGHGTAGKVKLRQTTQSNNYIFRWKPTEEGERGKVTWSLPAGDYSGVAVELVACAVGHNTGDNEYLEGPELCYELSRVFGQGAQGPICSVSTSQVDSSGRYMGSPSTSFGPLDLPPARGEPMPVPPCGSLPAGATLGVGEARKYALTYFKGLGDMWTTQREVYDLNTYLAAAVHYVTAKLDTQPVVFMLLNFTETWFLAVRYRPDVLPAIALTPGELKLLRDAGLPRRRARRVPNTQGDPDAVERPTGGRRPSAGGRPPDSGGAPPDSQS